MPKKSFIDSIEVEIISSVRFYRNFTETNYKIEIVVFIAF
jgi:hypothetical protein